MTSLPIGQAKARFSDVIRRVEDGDEVVITRGTKQDEVAVIVPIARWRESRQRDLGTLAHWGPVDFTDDWAMTDEELLASRDDGAQ